MLQKIIAFIIIALFLSRLFWQKQKKQITANEFIFWSCFWILAAVLVIGLQWIDKIVANLGFSASGIQTLLYLGIVVLFYLIFRLSMKIEKIEKNITKIIREIALKDKK